MADKAPDEFSFNFLGYTGKFYLDHQGKWAVQCDKPVKITSSSKSGKMQLVKEDDPYYKDTYINLSEMSCPFYEFTLTTEDGTQYVFGNECEAVEYSTELIYSRGQNWIANAWYLTKIILTNGDTVSFDYKRAEFVIQAYNALAYSLYKTAKTGGFLGTSCNATNELALDYGNNGSLISPVYLEQIHYPNGHISFSRSVSNELPVLPTIYESKYNRVSSDYEAANHFFPYIQKAGENYIQSFGHLKWYQLDSMVVDNEWNKTSQRIVFNYNDNPAERLALLSVSKQNDSISEGAYTLEYNSVGSLPGYLQHKNDHWGYFNNKNNSFYDNELKQGSILSFYNSREPTDNPIIASYGLLTKMTYPTGGYSRFVYEPHTYSKEVKERKWEGVDTLTENRYAGGSRIKEIWSSPTGENNDEYLDKQYVYSFLKDGSGLSSGVLGGKVKYLDVFDYKDGSSSYSAINISSQSVLPASVIGQGSYIGYTKVYEINHDNSYNSYVYSNYEDSPDERCCAYLLENRIPFGKYSSREMDRGLLKEKDIFGSDGKMRERTRYTYTKDAGDSYVRAMNTSETAFCSSSQENFKDGQSYKIFTYSWLPKSQTDTRYESNDTLYSRYDYDYNSDNQLISTTLCNNTTALEQKITKYAGDMHSQNNIILKNMKMRNMVGLPIENVHVLNGRIAEATLLTYKSNSLCNDKGSTDIVPDKYYKLETDTPLSLHTFTFYDGEKMDSHYNINPETQYVKYDSHSNILQTIERDSINYTFLWGYNHQLPIAVFKNTLNKDDYVIDSQPQSSRVPIHSYIDGNETQLFHTDVAGSFTVSLLAPPNTAWRITGEIDGAPFTLTSKTIETINMEWDSYANDFNFSCNLPQGDHILRINSIKSYPSSFNDDTHATLVYNHVVLKNTNIVNEALYLNFEDSTSTVPGYHSNKAYYTGSAQSHSLFSSLKLLPGKTYCIDYRILKKYGWVYKQDLFTANYNLPGNAIIDDVRVYPSVSGVNTFNYIPGFGMTSRTDEKGNTESYEYDPFGRLITVRNTLENKVKSYEYHYQQK